VDHAGQRVADERTARAARNNAAWCDTVCRAHGRPGEFLGTLWINRHAVPRFYPNAVTLVGATAAPAQLEDLRALVDVGLAGGWGVKDSFCALDLGPLGFGIRFDAEWIWRSPALPPPRPARTAIRWARVRSASALAAWEVAWHAATGDGTRAADDTIFRPALLADPDVAVFAGYAGSRVVAGAIANCAADVVGLSNRFALPADTADAAAGCVAAAVDTFPGMPIVGYERGRDLATARALRFETLGRLRVWVKTVSEYGAA